jgi:hypothetical protein
VQLITFHTLWGTAAKVGRMPEGLTIKTLSAGSRILKFFPSDYAVAQFAMLEYFTHIGSWLESYHEYRVLFITARVSLSILVSCFIFAV